MLIDALNGIAAVIDRWSMCCLSSCIGGNNDFFFNDFFFLVFVLGLVEA
jgi:hypothetical protein